MCLRVTDDSMTALEKRSATAESPASPRTFTSQLQKKWDEGRFVCVGLDSEYGKIPKIVKEGQSVGHAILAFNKAIIDATHDLVCAYKANSAFYEAEGVDGINALEQTVQYVKHTYPDIPVILDAKRADIGNTNNGYVTFAFDTLGVDAITVHPYLGKEALSPFLRRKDKGIIVLVRTSNPGAGEFQDAMVHGMPLYEYVARHVVDWNVNGNVAIVAGATFPQELARIRKIVGTLPILIPGIGTQGGDVEKAVKAGRDEKNEGMIVNSSRGIIFASDGPDFARAARRATLTLHDKINESRVAGSSENDAHPEGLTDHQEKLLVSLFDIGAIKFGDFRLKLHETYPDAPLSPLYIDLRMIRRFPETKRAAVEAYRELVAPLSFDLLADIPTAATPVVASLSEVLNIGMITPRTDAKSHGSGAKIDGMTPEDAGKTAVLIDDLVTHADSKLEAAAILQKQGYTVRDIVVLIDRQQGGEEQLEAKGFRLHAACTLTQILTFYERIEKITALQHKDIRRRLDEITAFTRINH